MKMRFQLNRYSFGVIAKTLLGLLILIMVCCSTKQTTEIKIGAILPLTGDAAFYGESIKNGLDLAAKQINSHGGIKGANVHLIYEDSRALPAEGVSAFQKLVSIGGVKAIIGDAVSSVTLAFAPLADKQKIIVMSPLSSAPAISEAGDFIFRNVPSDLVNGKSAADFLIRDKGMRKFGVLFVNNDFGLGLKDAFAQRTAQLGGEVVATEAYDPGSSDFRTQLTKIASANPEAVFIVGYSELAQALVQAKEMKMTCTFIGTGLMEDPTILKNARDAANGVFFTQLGYDPTSKDSAVMKFVDGYKREFGVEPNIIAAYGYDALMVLSFAMNKSNLSPDDIKEQLYAVKNYSGVTGEISFDSNGDVTQPMGVKKIENGKFEWVKRVIESY